MPLELPVARGSHYESGTPANRIKYGHQNSADIADVVEDSDNYSGISGQSP
jgi:hypothetical protein